MVSPYRIKEKRVAQGVEWAKAELHRGYVFSSNDVTFAAQSRDTGA